MMFHCRHYKNCLPHPHIILCSLYLHGERNERLIATVLINEGRLFWGAISYLKVIIGTCEVSILVLIIKSKVHPSPSNCISIITIIIVHIPFNIHAEEFQQYYIANRLWDCVDAVRLSWVVVWVIWWRHESVIIGKHAATGACTMKVIIFYIKPRTPFSDKCAKTNLHRYFLTYTGSVNPPPREKEGK